MSVQAITSGCSFLREIRYRWRTGGPIALPGRGSSPGDGSSPFRCGSRGRRERAPHTAVRAMKDRLAFPAQQLATCRGHHGSNPSVSWPHEPRRSFLRGLPGGRGMIARLRVAFRRINGTQLALAVQWAAWLRVGASWPAASNPSLKPGCLDASTVMILSATRLSTGCRCSARKSPRADMMRAAGGAWVRYAGHHARRHTP